MNQLPTIKEIVKDNIAYFLHYRDGCLYYFVKVNNIKYSFPINIFDKEDIGDAIFLPEFKAITLMRYIRKALKNDNFMQISQ